MFRLYTRRSSRTSSLRGKARGQAVVEFALVMVFFLVILLGVIDLGRLWFTVVAVEHAAAEGSLFGLAHPWCITAGAGCEDPNNIEYRLKHESQGDIIDPSKLTYAVTCDPDCSPGGIISVEVTYDFDLIAPGLSVFGADSIPIRRVSRQIIAAAPEE
jgi:hypothetical protein